MRNVELLEKTMQYILDHPEKHAQGLWTNGCGTAACFAGWACYLAGFRNHENDSDCISYYGEPYHVGDLAQRLLGLTFKERRCLFYGVNTRAELELIVKDLVNGDELRDHADYCKEAI